MGRTWTAPRFAKRGLHPNAPNADCTPMHRTWTVSFAQRMGPNPRSRCSSVLRRPIAYKASVRRPCGVRAASSAKVQSKSPEPNSRAKVQSQSPKAAQLAPHRPRASTLGDAFATNQWRVHTCTGICAQLLHNRALGIKQFTTQKKTNKKASSALTSLAL